MSEPHADHDLRSYARQDLYAVLGVLKAAMPADPITLERFTRQVLLDPNFRPEGAPVARVNGVVLGFCLSIARQVPLENAPPDADRGYITLLGVRPDHQHRGVGAALLARAENYLSVQGRTTVMISSYAPGYFIPGVDVNAYAGALSFLKKHGYTEVYRPLAMETSLWDLREPAWVTERRRQLLASGTVVTGFSPALAPDLLDFARREFPGDWVRVIRETASRIAAGDSARRLLIAVDNGTVVGFSHYENERFGPIGVAATQRGRGVGQVLMYETLAAQRAAGFRCAWFLWSDDKTAERIYTAAGFKETRRFALMKKTL